MESEQSGDAMVVIEFGKHSKKRIKDLRKGKGKLMTELELAVSELKERGVVGADVAVVAVVVERKVAEIPFLFPKLGR